MTRETHEAKIARWRAMPQPYCVTSFSASAGRYMPMGKRRFATIEKALAAAKDDGRTGKMRFVDYAGAFERAA